MSLDLNLVCLCPHLPLGRGKWRNGQTPLKPRLIRTARPRAAWQVTSLLHSHQLQRPRDRDGSSSTQPLSGSFQVSITVPQDPLESEQGRVAGSCPGANLERWECPGATFFHPPIHSVSRHLSHALWAWCHAAPEEEVTLGTGQTRKHGGSRWPVGSEGRARAQRHTHLMSKCRSHCRVAKHGANMSTASRDRPFSLRLENHRGDVDGTHPKLTNALFLVTAQGREGLSLSPDDRAH